MPLSYLSLSRSSTSRLDETFVSIDRSIYHQDIEREEFSSDMVTLLFFSLRKLDVIKRK